MPTAGGASRRERLAHMALTAASIDTAAGTASASSAGSRHTVWP
jgi:hypothetical protein